MEVVRLRLAGENTSLASQYPLPLIYLYTNPLPEFIDLYPNSIRFEITENDAKNLLDYQYKDFKVIDELPKHKEIYDSMLKIAAGLSPEIKIWGLVPINLQKVTSHRLGIQFLAKFGKNRRTTEHCDPYGVNSILRMHGNDTSGNLCLSCTRLLHNINGECKLLDSTCRASINLSGQSYFMQLKRGPLVQVE